ncbi:hypothetical protein D3C86_1662970 [compost metagenome]
MCQFCCWLNRVPHWIAPEEACKHEADHESNAEGESHTRIGHGRGAAESHPCGGEDDGVQDRPDENEDDGDVDRHSFAHESAHERDHAAFTEGKHNA